MEKDLEKRVDDLETELEKLKGKFGNRRRQMNIRWDAILILGIWLITAMILCFAPIGKDNWKEIVGAASTATVLAILFF